MKPFLGIDITEDKHNEEINGDEFIAAKPSETSLAAMENSWENAGEMEGKSKLPLPIRVGHWICGFLAFCAVVGIFDVWAEDENMTFSLMYQKSPWVFYLAVICFIAWGILKFISHKKEEKLFKSDEYDFASSKLDTAAENILTELKVPASAPWVDIISLTYRIKDGVPKPRERASEMSPYNNACFKAFTDSENLYFVSYDRKYCFPLSSLKTICTVQKKIPLTSWNKDTPPKQGEYKKYKLVIDNFGRVHTKPYHILEAEINGETWGIYFPCYELSVIESLTGLKAE